MDEKTAYEEAGRVHRYFLNWRHAAFAGYFAVLYAVASLAERLWDNTAALVAVLLLSAPIGVALTLVDRRNRKLYHAAVEAAIAMEAGENGNLYARLAKPPDERAGGSPGPHSRVLAFVYWGYSVVLVLAAVAVLWSRFCR